MNPKLKTLLLIAWPIFLILIWVVGFFALTKKNKPSVQTNILNSQTSQSTSLQNTTQTSSKKNIVDNIDENEITIYMPSVFYWLDWKNIGLENLDKKIESEKVNSSSKNNDKIRYRTFWTIWEYKNFLAKNINNLTGEIYLIPSTWVDDFIPLAQNFRLDEGSTSIFNYSTTQIIKDTKLGMIPYAIDIPVFLTQNVDQNFSFNIKVEELKNILLLNKKSSDSLKFFPIAFWIDKPTLNILQKWSQPFEWYENSLQIIFDLISKTSNINMLKSLQEFWDETNTLYQTYNLSWINSWINTYSKAKSNQFPECKTYKSLCLLQSDKTNIVFWNLSDLDILQSKFNKKVDIHPFFKNQWVHPSVVWYLMIKKDLTPTKQSIAIKYFKTYMDNANAGDTSFWNNTISPINNSFERQNKNQYENIIWSLGNLYAVRGKLDSVKNILNDKDMSEFFKTSQGSNEAMKILIWD